MPVVRLRAYLQAPIALCDVLHLDALLVSASFGGGAHRLTRSSDASEIQRPPIPLFLLHYAEHEVYLGSALEVAPEARWESEHLTRRRSPEDLDALTKPVETRTGPGRDVLLRFPAVLTPYVEWWGVAHRRSLLRAVREVTHVGMLRRHGYGAVLRWEAETHRDAPPESVLCRAGRARRHLPAEWCEKPELLESVPVRAPYWHSSSVVTGIREGRATGLAAGLLARMPDRC